MKSMKATILEAYNETIRARVGETDTVSVGSVVEDIGGDRYVVTAVSDDPASLSEYDKSGAIPVITEQTTATRKWLALRDKMGRESVSVYGDDGVTLVGKAEEADYSKIDHSIMDAYHQVTEG